jgi:hypothetical protein
MFNIKGTYQAGRLVPGQQEAPVAQLAKPTQPPPPASDVPAPAPTIFGIPVVKVSWPPKTTADLKTVSEALGAAKTQMMGAPLLAIEPSEKSHIKTTGAVEKDLADVSKGIAGEDLADEGE